MKIAVTGGSGQLGTLVLRRLVADPRVESVVSLDLAAPRVASDKLSHVEIDIRAHELARHLAGVDVVVHLAFMVTAWAPKDVFFGVNVEGTKNVFQSGVSAGVTRFVYTSSVAAYGVVPGHPDPLVEDSPRVHQTDFPYAECKWLVEDFLDGFEAAHPEIFVARMRPAILIGAQMDHPLGQSLRAGMLSDMGTAPMPLVWDEDVADAVVLAVLQRAKGAFNLAASEPLPTEQLAKAVGLRVMSAPKGVMRSLVQASKTLAEYGIGRAHDPAWIEHGDAVMVMSSERARTQLGWKPVCPTSVDVMRRYIRVVPARGDARLLAFFASARALGELGTLPDGVSRARVHVRVTGRAGGDWTLVVTDGKCIVSKGFPRSPTAVVTVDATDLISLINAGGAWESLVSAWRVSIEGNASHAALLGWLIAQLLASTKQPGAKGWAARAMVSWINR